ncbi:hypothetical protein SPI_00547 [Niveomyces insectorum RCEF 264]|uniref:C6 zinc finger domain containing protein n=1 Tax=Niveomyces insectorum RCEF 264 TaxID=1081102 RepID=A0A162JFY3_9HYPO|nr:hypothetical protein SPI_00547 [Niveomyces insectorum RCEF 264]
MADSNYTTDGSPEANAAAMAPGSASNGPESPTNGPESPSNGPESPPPPGFITTPADGTATAQRDRRDSDEWDASKVPPSRFQKRKGSIYSTPGSRDGHVDSNYAAKFHAKHAEKGYNKTK